MKFLLAKFSTVFVFSWFLYILHLSLIHFFYTLLSLLFPHSYHMRYTLPILIVVLLGSLLWWNWPHNRSAIAKAPKTDSRATTSSGETQYRKAYFAAGCFWCAESSFEHYPGVIDAVSGYAGGTEANPTYEQVGSQQTSHREAVEVIYDANIINYDDLLQIFWRTAYPLTASMTPG